MGLFSMISKRICGCFFVMDIRVNEDSHTESKNMSIKSVCSDLAELRLQEGVETLMQIAAIRH